jgi:filamentous hemagglutinin
MGVEARKAIDAYVGPRKAELRQRVKREDLPNQDKDAARDLLRKIEREERVINILVGAVTGLVTTSAAREVLGEVSKQMRAAMIDDSKKFAGIKDSPSGDGMILSNISGISQGIDDDGTKVGGTRVDLDLVCGPDNRRCERLSQSNELRLDSEGYVRFLGEPGGAQNLRDFLRSENGKKMAGMTGGVQGAQGTFFGIPYAPGSWIDALVESFSGPHDLVGGKKVGAYGDDGTMRRGRDPVVARTQDLWSATGAIVVSTPFATATLLPPEIWTAIGILLRGAR